MHIKPKQASPLGYYVPGLVLGLLAVISVTYLLYQPMLYFVLAYTVYYLSKRYFVRDHHPLGLTQEEINRSKDLFVCIVGAGFSGICMAIKLKLSGIPFRVLEKNSDLGGVWQANNYPGLSCDVWALVYEFSFYLNPNWSGWVASRGDILKYLQSCVDHFKIREYFSFNVEVESAIWDEAHNCWRILTLKQEVISATHLVSSCGWLSKPQLPDIRGREKFLGMSFHSAEWMSGYDYKGKKVAIIGNAASAVQIAPAIFKDVRSLHVFQRTPSWHLPKQSLDVPNWVKQLYRNVPFAIQIGYGITVLLGEIYAKIWLRKGKLSQLFQQKVLKKNIEDDVGGNEILMKKLTPNFEPGCRRILFHSDFLPMFQNRPDKAHLITDPISEITGTGIMAGNHHYKFDLIVYATGFDVTGSICGFKTIGAGGVNLRDQINSDPTAYLGMTVKNFPNFFFLLGPNSILTHNSVTILLEMQTEYIIQCLRGSLRYGIRSMEVKKKSMKNFRQMVDALTLGTNLASNCGSFYKNEQGFNYVVWPASIWKYWTLVRKVEFLRDYKLTFFDS